MGVQAFMTLFRCEKDCGLLPPLSVVRSLAGTCTCAACGAPAHPAAQAEIVEEMVRRLALLYGADATPGLASAMLAGRNPEAAQRLQAAREVEEILSLAGPLVEEGPAPG